MVLPFLAAAAAWAPVIGAGITAIGSLMRPAPTEQKITNSIDLKKLRSDAEEAGFNPLAIIRGGGLAGYGTQVIPAGPDTRFSDAFMAFGSGVANFDPHGSYRGAAEMSRMETVIGRMGQSGAPSNLSFETPKSFGGAPGVLRTASGAPLVTGPGSPAQDMETDYGEAVGDVYGVWRWFSDVHRRNWRGEIPVSWDATGWRPDPRGTPSRVVTGGGF